MFTILDPGALTTIQDAGRVGWARYGIPPSGPMDTAAFMAANRLVGNPVDAAALEITLTGPVLRAWRDCLIAVCGADFELWVDRLTVPTRHAIYLRAGSILKFGARHNGARAYLAVNGGIKVPLYLGSRSTYLKGGFGGLEGRALQAGDRLPLGNATNAHPIESAGAHLTPSSRATTSLPAVRVVLGPQEDYFSAETIEVFLSTRYTVTTAADRMGIRLAGARLNHAEETGIVSDGIITGSIQIPPDGQPIVMMVDHQTTGGYPKIATVIQADVPVLAQRLPGDEISFTQVSLEDARAAYQETFKSQKS